MAAHTDRTCLTPWRSYLLVMRASDATVVAVLPTSAAGFGEPSVLTRL